MGTFAPKDPTEAERQERNWALEIVIVLGVIAFGYFAVTLPDAPIFSSSPIAALAD
jgi:hypothetical protein